jgi:hypothetical protein
MSGNDYVPSTPPDAEPTPTPAHTDSGAVIPEPDPQAADTHPPPFPGGNHP